MSCNWTILTLLKGLVADCKWFLQLFLQFFVFVVNPDTHYWHNSRFMKLECINEWHINFERAICSEICGTNNHTTSAGGFDEEVLKLCQILFFMFFFCYVAQCQLQKDQTHHKRRNRYHRFFKPVSHLRDCL